VIGVPEPKPDIYEVTEEAWPAVSFFLSVQTQWRMDSGVLIGLDYNAVRWMMELFEVKKPVELMSDLQIIEAKVVEVMCRRSEK
jgi:hypothetical protein